MNRAVHLLASFLSSCFYLEGRVPDEQLVEEAAQGPEVDALVVAAGEHQLRRQVLRSAAEREGLRLQLVVLVEGDLLREAEVDDLCFGLIWKRARGRGMDVLCYYVYFVPTLGLGKGEGCVIRMYVMYVCLLHGCSVSSSPLGSPGRRGGGSRAVNMYDGEGEE